MSDHVLEWYLCCEIEICKNEDARLILDFVGFKYVGPNDRVMNIWNRSNTLLDRYHCRLDKPIEHIILEIV